MVRALSTAQTQSVREIKKNADIKKANKKLSVFVVTFFIMLIIGFIAFKAYTYYQSTKFDFKETEKGINFYSKDMPIKDALQVSLDSNKIAISTNLLINYSGTTNPVLEPSILATTIFVFKDKNTININNRLDENFSIIKCSTNYGDNLTSVDLNSTECLALFSQIESKLVINTPNPSLKESRVDIYPMEKTIIINSKSETDLLVSTYLLLKANYSDVESILFKVENIKKKLSNYLDSNSVKDTNSTTPPDYNNQDSNLEDLNN
jgi:hypothetical protein